MPLYMDIHNLPEGTTAEDVAKAHAKDMETQRKQNNDLFGSTVQLAARLCAHAQPEQILVSNAIPDLCIGKGLLFEDLGEVDLKGFGYPVRAHVAAWKPATT